MIATITQFIIIAIILGVFDYIWLNFIFLKYWKKMINNIQLKPMNVKSQYILPAYILMTISIVFFALPKISNDNIVLDSLKYGGLLGLVIYGIFDLTNLVVFEKYTLNIAIVDISWGTFLFAITTYISKIILNKLKYIV